jgi:hypothetical protein
MGALVPTGLAIVGIASLIGRLVLNPAADYVGRLNIMKIASVFFTLSLIVWPYSASSTALFYVTCFVFGFFAGAYPSVPPGVVFDYGKVYKVPYPSTHPTRFIRLLFLSSLLLASFKTPSLSDALSYIPGCWVPAYRRPVPDRDTGSHLCRACFRSPVRGNGIISRHLDLHCCRHGPGYGGPLLRTQEGRA